MLPGQGPVLQAVLGTLLTWGLTAAGSALVFVFSSGQRRILDGSLGFAAGVMLAASYWSLLAPAIEMAEESGAFGAFAFLPVAVGFVLGAAFVYGADLLIPVLGFSGPPHAAFALSYDPRAAKEKYEHDPASRPDYESELSIRIGRAGHHPDKGENGEPYQRRKGAGSSLPDGPPPFPVPKDSAPTGSSSSSWRRILLMILAITIHNIPEGLAVGVGFGAVGKSASATFQSARNLAIGIGIQNFPEGLAVSLPLRGAGFSTWKAFWYGQLSGMVEPLAGVFGAFAVVVAEPLLPYALGFAAGAMVYVVMDDIIPEAQTSAECRPAVAATLRALNAALGGPAALWVKESSARNLRHRDFLAPRAALRAAFSGGQVPADVIAGVTSASGPGVLAVRGCQQTAAGLAVQLRRPEAFRRLLGPPPGPDPPPAAGPGPEAVVLHCPALRSPAALAPRHLRPVLLADHLAQLLRAQGVSARLVPAVSNQGSLEVLRQLRVEWPSGGAASPDAVLAFKQALSRCPYATACEPGAASLPEDVICKVHLKSFVEQQGLAGYDPNLDVLLVTEGKLRSLAELQQAVLQCTAGGQGSRCSVVHVVSCEEEFQQQQMDLLWRILDPGAHAASQKHLVCGPVKVTNPSFPIGADQYFQLRKRQMYDASVLKYGELAQDEAWTEVVDTLTVAAIRFELLSTAHRSQLTLDLEASSISTKGTKSGAFVMYNCARLATLFDTYLRAVEQGTYPPLPPAATLNFSCLREEGEWLLLFNYLLPFPEVLQQAAQLPAPSKGHRITANTEAVCKFLIQLSMDFSSYYNRVHVLGEPFPHLFDQMFARLQLLGAVRDLFHRALATLHLPPLSQI